MKKAFLVVIALSFPIAAMASAERDAEHGLVKKMPAVKVELGAHRSAIEHREFTWRSVGENHAAARSAVVPGSVKSVAAPEIDPASAAGGLTLLLGGIAVLRGRKLRDV